jgi:hypothetical protein
MGLSDKHSGRLFFPKIEGEFDYKRFPVTCARGEYIAYPGFVWGFLQAATVK